MVVNRICVLVVLVACTPQSQLGGMSAIPESSPTSLAPGPNFSFADYTPLDDAPTCEGTKGQWAGCRTTGCLVCSDKVEKFPCYFKNHPDCTPNPSCDGKYFTCNASCPAPVAKDTCARCGDKVCNGTESCGSCAIDCGVCASCKGTEGQWKGCRGTGCSVCSDQLEEFPCYLKNHPNCVSTSCEGQYFTCNSGCPQPTAADKKC